MMRVKLTDEQIAASTSGERRLFIEATPGSGKTTVAAERYGVLRFDINRDIGSSITAVSFARSATHELYRRIIDRWSSRALEWPHSVTTIDTLIRDIVHYLLRCGAILWLNDHTTIEVLDNWRWHSGYRWLKVGNNYRRVVTLDDDNLLTSVGCEVSTAQFGFGDKLAFHKQLESGRCTHEDMRNVLTAALQRDDLRSRISEYLGSTISHMIIDEIFDANQLDLTLVELCCEIDINLTIVGDPWQALYEFRGARPDHVKLILERWNFMSLPLSQSFRFHSKEMKQLNRLLRCSQPIDIGVDGPHEVVLASQWNCLWTGPDYILPLSFGRINNKNDAAVVLLLDHLVRSQFSEHAIFLSEALILLSIDRQIYSQKGPPLMAEVTKILTSGAPDAPKRAFNHLRDAIKSLSALSPPQKESINEERQYIEKFGRLEQRLSAQRPLMPGVTIHQAKGREWDNVGVRLNSSEISRLKSGLDPTVEKDRTLYVALTRARQNVTRL